MKVLSVLRDVRYSPNSETNDRSIMESVVRLLQDAGHHVDVVAEAELPATGRCLYGYDICLTMGRRPETLEIMKEMEHDGTVVLNSAAGLERCRRSTLDTLMRRHGVSMPPQEGHHGWWLKRGDASAQDADDVIFCQQPEDVEKAMRAFRSRGITDVVKSAHVEGDLVKFYGVLGTGFFHTLYPTSVGRSKFGAERMNGMPHYYSYDKRRLQSEAERLSQLALTPIYGGDCIVDAEGRFYIIDFNDWPSFSPCREEAAAAIASLAQANISSKLD